MSNTGNISGVPLRKSAEVLENLAAPTKTKYQTILLTDAVESSRKGAIKTRLVNGMDRYPAKPIANKDHITLIIPTRGRVAELAYFLGSIDRTTARKDLVDAWIYVDDDDLATLEFSKLDLKQFFSFSVNFIVGPRTLAQAEMVHAVWQGASSNSGIFVSATDDSEYLTIGWDEVIRAAFNKYPDRLALVYPDDPVTPGLATIPILSAEWLNLVGRFLTEYFPYWYDDVWLDEVAQLIGRKEQAEMIVRPQGGKGKTPRMRNMPFWQGFFIQTADERLEMVRTLKRIINSRAQAPQLDEAQDVELMQGFVRKHSHSVETLLQAERLHSDPIKTATPQSCNLYQMLESRALSHLWSKFHYYRSARKFNQALEIIGTIKLASTYTSDADYLEASCYVECGNKQRAKEILSGALSRDPGNFRCQHLLNQLS